MAVQTLPTRPAHGPGHRGLGSWALRLAIALDLVLLALLIVLPLR